MTEELREKKRIQGDEVRAELKEYMRSWHLEEVGLTASQRRSDG